MYAYKVRFDASQITQEDLKQWLADWCISRFVVYEVSYSKSKWFRGDSNLNPHYQGLIYTAYTERQLRCKSKKAVPADLNPKTNDPKVLKGILSYITEGGNKSYSIGKTTPDTLERYLQYLCKGTRKHLPLIFDQEDTIVTTGPGATDAYHVDQENIISYHKAYWEEYDHNTKPKVYGLEKMFQELDFGDWSARSIGKAVLKHYLEMWKTVPPPAVLKSIIRTLYYKHKLLENPGKSDHDKIMDLIFEEIYFN